jgi:hypothetical protein
MRRFLLAGGLWLCPVAALAQAVTPADLEDYVVEARIVMDQQIRRDGRDIAVQLHQRLRVSFLVGNAIEWEMSSTSHTPRGPRQGPSQKGRLVLGKVIDARNLDGGQAVWFFEDGVLTSLRTYGNAGGYKRTIRFTRNADGIGCSVVASHVREEGVGRVETRSVIDNLPVTILSAKQTSSACKVSKRPAT